MNSPLAFLDSMVLGSTSPTATPPEVTTASSTGRGPDSLIVKSFSVSNSLRRCSRRISRTLTSAGMPVRSISTGTMDRGASPPKALA